tara:strand:- start:230 stop:1960 length:1731 start_codon:yes stop_codon:yes gene_type:complete
MTLEKSIFTDLKNDHNNLKPIHKHSHVKGSSSPPLVNCTISNLLKKTVSEFPQRDAFIFPDHKLNYKEFDHMVDKLATGFIKIGLKKGDRLGIWSPNRLEWVLTQFATARIGVILVNINPAYRLSELEYSLNKVGCKALILAKNFKSSEYLKMILSLAPELRKSKKGKLKTKNLPQLNHVILMDQVDETYSGLWMFEEIFNIGGYKEKQKLFEIDKTLKPDDAINIQFTSGTTGQPKGATLSHYNIVNNGSFVTDRIKLTEKDRLALPVPLYHCFGMVMGVLGAISKGAAMIFPGESFDAKETLDVLVKEKCTALYGVPTMFVAILEELNKSSCDLSNMRTGIMAGALCPIEVMKKVNDLMNMKEVTICYGMTETSPVSFQSFVNDPTEKRCKTVGRIHPHLEVKIVDKFNKIVPIGEQGELCTRGYSVMKEYWNDVNTTNEVINDGWMHTGDLGVFDEDGFCSITGRLKDMIIRGGENIYPREIEEFLFLHPKISEAQVFGVPDDKLGEIVCAWIVLKEGLKIDKNELEQFCHGKIAHFKIPKFFEVVKELPMTITGKPQKFVMRERMIEILNLM